MDDGNGVLFKIVYSGSLTYTNVTGLTPGVKYNFYVTAVNFNGEGTSSNKAEIISCVAPSGVQAPSLIDSTSTSITLRWTQPQDTGGCSITSYALFRDNGINGPITTIMN